MAYRALLFCPDEKAARTVTQVLGELEFTVEPCIEPFAAVKRLMGEHFDAVVVDCDNEQNATLLFKSARNSTSNQASLAVAVVEGQAGVAKAFRIGANLVLTKPINIEQSKGTLRVARGLLRKGEPAKPGTPVAAASTTTVSTKPVPTRPVAPAKPAPPAAVSTPRPAPPVAKPAATPSFAATASSSPVAHDGNLPEIGKGDSAATPSAVSPAITNLDAPAPPAPRLPALGSQTPSIEVTSGFKGSSSASSGAASAAAPAREPHDVHAAEKSTTSTTKEADLFEKPAAAAHSESSASPAPEFTFGGSNVPEESSGGSKKVLFGVAAAVLVAVGLYFGWTYFQGRSTQPSSQTIAAPVPVATTPQAAKPTSSQPKPVSTAPSTSPSSSSSLPAVQPPDTSAAAGSEEPDAEPVPEKAAPSASNKPSSSASSPAGKSSATKPEPAPLVVKGGSVPATHAKPAASDVSAPSMIGMATPGSTPPPNLVGSAANEPRPVLQTLNISQGVSQGLLIKKVQPIYPRNALAMHVEGAVELMATISTSGSITSVKVLRGEQLLTRAAVDAVKQWKYKPYELNGEPVEIQTEVTVNFKLPH